MTWLKGQHNPLSTDSARRSRHYNFPKSGILISPSFMTKRRALYSSGPQTSPKRSPGRKPYFSSIELKLLRSIAEKRQRIGKRVTRSILVAKFFLQTGRKIDNLQRISDYRALIGVSLQKEHSQSPRAASIWKDAQIKRWLAQQHRKARPSSLSTNQSFSTMMWVVVRMASLALVEPSLPKVETRTWGMEWAHSLPRATGRQAWATVNMCAINLAQEVERVAMT